MILYGNATDFVKKLQNKSLSRVDCSNLAFFTSFWYIIGEIIRKFTNSRGFARKKVVGLC